MNENTRSEASARRKFMKISKKDALMWFRFFAALPEEEEILPHQQEIVYATFAQIEAAVEHRNAQKMAQIPGLQSLAGRIGLRAL